MNQQDVEWISPSDVPWTQGKLPFLGAGVGGIFLIALLFAFVPAPFVLELFLLVATPVGVIAMYLLAPVRLGIRDDEILILKRSTTQVIGREEIARVKILRQLWFSRLEVQFRNGKRLILALPQVMATPSIETRLRAWLGGSINNSGNL